MRVWFAVGLAILAGTGVGFAVAWAKIFFHPCTRDLGGDAPPARADAFPAAADVKALPRVVAEEDSYDFGSMDAYTSDQHEFVFANQGAGPLRLAKGETSCKCAVAKLEEVEIPPGGSTKIAVRWSASSPTDEFRHSVTILTNDPSRPRLTLTITGRVTAVVKAVPSSLVFGRVSAGDEATASVRLYGYASRQSLEVKGYRLEETGNAKYFDVVLTPLTAGQLKDELRARSGVEARITVRPGLPLGPFRQRLSFSTNLEEGSTVDVPIGGDIVSEISVAGRDFDPLTGVLMLGTVRSSQGAERTVRIFVRGPYCKDVRFEPEEVSPSLLRVRLGKTTEAGSGAVTLTPVTIEVPRGSPPANHLGSEQAKLGRVTLKTHHPQSPQLRIYIRFAVEG